MVLALQQNYLSPNGYYYSVIAIYIFKLIVFYLSKEHFTDELIYIIIFYYIFIMIV